MFTTYGGARCLRALRSAVLCVFAILFTAPLIDANAASLSNSARRAHLYYYAPLILKEAEESSSTGGKDWITNYDFDRDGVFGNNGSAWSQKVGIYSVDPNALNVANWKIRPTLYAAAIEFKNTKDNSKSLILIYHVYHALEDGSVHDWERVELRINNVQSTPGPLETVRYLVHTEHTIHAVLQKPTDAAFTPRTASGYHPLIWQARWKNGDKPDKNQLLRVTGGWSALKSAVECSTGSCTAQVGLSSYGRQPVHYVFVPQEDLQQVAFWGAVPITKDNAATLGAGKTAAVPWAQVKRITYELQDIADIMPTHAEVKRCTGADPATENNWKLWDAHWEAANNTDILMESAVKSESGTVLVPASTECANDNPVLYHRYTKNDPDDAQGYPHKHWFWGTYKMNGEGGDLDDKAFKGGAVVSGTADGGPQKRICAGYNDYWCQHDYYVHTGNTTTANHGWWLPVGWHTEAEGGFDGRWVQLFDDNH